MRETMYGSTLAREIEYEIGGKVIKLSDKSTLGLPDNIHMQDGISTYIETKVSDSYDSSGVYPWKSAEKDIRQF